MIVEEKLLSHFAVWIHIDFLPIGNVDPSVLDAELRAYAYRQIRAHLEAHFSTELTSSGDALRNCFADEIEAATLTILHKVDRDSEHWNTIVNDLVSKLYQSDESL